MIGILLNTLHSIPKQHDHASSLRTYLWLTEWALIAKYQEYSDQSKNKKAQYKRKHAVVHELANDRSQK